LDWARGQLDSIATIRTALDLGINWLDTTARIYGLTHSEEVLGIAIKELREGKENK